jgi:hypothetical protein
VDLSGVKTSLDNLRQEVINLRATHEGILSELRSGIRVTPTSTPVVVPVPGNGVAPKIVPAMPAPVPVPIPGDPKGKEDVSGTSSQGRTIERQLAEIRETRKEISATISEMKRELAVMPAPSASGVASTSKR